MYENWVKWNRNATYYRAELTQLDHASSAQIPSSDPSQTQYNPAAACSDAYPLDAADVQDVLATRSLDEEAT